MAKYKKQQSRYIGTNRTKKKMFETVMPKTREGISFVDALALSEIQNKVQSALELERDEIVGRSWHDHHEQGMPVHYRNGYSNPRSLTCGSGTMQIQMPRLRTAYESNVVEKYQRLTEAIQLLLPQLYLHGLATGDFEPAFGWLWGDRLCENSLLIREKMLNWREEKIKENQWAS